MHMHHSATIEETFRSYKAVNQAAVQIAAEHSIV
jgi:hypothetical protein